MDSSMLFWTAIIAVATLAYVIVTGYLLKLNSALLNLTREIFESTNRPFISFETVASYPTSFTRPEHVFIGIKNTGNLPAKNIIPICQIKIDGKNLAFDITPSDKIFLFPGSHNVYAIKPHDLDIITNSLKSKLSIEIFFELKYDSTSDHTFTTKGFYSYNYTHDGFKIVDGTWS